MVDLPYNATSYINSSLFWAELEGMVELLEPIDMVLQQSESNSSHLGMVFERWKTILSHLMRSQNQHSYLEEFIQPDGVFAERYQRQVIPIHFITFYLTSTNISVPLDLQHEAQIFQFFQQYSS